MPINESKLNNYHGRKRDRTIELPDRDGLVASVGRSGKISWVFRYRFDNKQKRLTFGYYPAISLKEAREKTVSYVRMMSEGEDPKYSGERSATVTLDQCCQLFIEKKFPDLRDKTKVNYGSLISNYINNKRFPHCVQKARFEYWVGYFDKITKESSSVNAGGVFKLVRTILRYCRSRNLIQSSELFDVPFSAIGTSSKVGQRTLTMAEMGLAWNLIGQSNAGPPVKACLKLLMVFGARNSEVRESMRDEFDLLEGIWTVPGWRSKTGKPIRRPIPELAVKIIEELDAIYGEQGYLIKGQHRGTFLTIHSVNRFTVRLLGKMNKVKKTDRFTPHDFRRTLSTRLSEENILPHVTEKMLGHELQGVMAVYNKHDWLEDQKKAYALWCEMLMKAARDDLSRSY